LSDEKKTINPKGLSVARALGGSPDALSLLKAHVEATEGEHRPQQEEMTVAVENAIINHRPILAQAGTGSGKGLSYLFPLASTQKRAVVATATNQLSEQLMRHDLPQVKKTIEDTGGELSFALLKGRNNYVCKAKVAELESLEKEAGRHGGGEQDSLFGDEDNVFTKKAEAKSDSLAVGRLLPWAKSTYSGDRSEAPTVIDRVWNQVSTSAADCPGAQTCPFGDICFTETARKIAKEAQIVVTNHALLAQDIKAALTPMGENSNSVFGKRDVIIVDEAHDFPDAITSALSTEVDQRSIGKYLSKAAKYIDEKVDGDGEPLTIKSARADVEDLTFALSDLKPGAIEELPTAIEELLITITAHLLTIDKLLKQASIQASKDEKHKRATAITVLAEQGMALASTLNSARSLGAGAVRWVDKDRRDDSPILRTAPIEIGPFLREGLEDKTFVATSATLTLGKDFSPILRTLGFTKESADTLDVGSPFDYPNQGMLYIPTSPFPEPVGKDRTEHTAAVLDEITELVRAAGGRTLALFTTTAGAQKCADHLRNEFPGLTIHAHGDAPADVLVRDFAAEETSVLCATMGLWQGVSIEGASCSLVIIDKIAFAPVDDVLTAARKAHVDSLGRDGFTEVIVAQAATSLAQGIGRLIRVRSDKGVAVLLDPRILTKRYGRLLLSSLPNFRIFSDHDQVVGALNRLTGGLHPEALTSNKGKHQYSEKSSPAHKSEYAAKPKGKVTPRAGAKRNINLKSQKVKKIID
jgi:ATP-dependent DNA helicase DinG